MPTSTSSTSNTIAPPPEDEAAMANIERRAFLGQLPLAQARHEIFALRDRFAPEPVAVMRWAALSRS